MKRFIRYFLYSLFAPVVVVCFLGGFLTRNTRYGLNSFSHKKIDNETKKLLFHIFGVKNMSPEDKRRALQNSPDFMKCYKGDIDSILPKVFPDHINDYAVDSNFVINFHLANGNPKIRVGFISCQYYKSYYQDDAWGSDDVGIFLCPFNYKGEPAIVDASKYFGEISHSMQFYQTPVKYAYMKNMWDLEWWIPKKRHNYPQKYIDSLEYKTVNTAEYEAHRFIQSVQEQYYLNYRRKCFKEQIDPIEEELQNKGSAILEARRDSLVYGPSFIP